MPTSLWMNILALLACAVGVFFLWRSWRGWKPLGNYSAAIGWLSVAVGILLWVQSAGGEFGTSYALIAVSLAAWVVCARAVEWRPARPRYKSGANNSGGTVVAIFGATSGWHKLGTFMTAGPLACAAACLGTAALAGWLPIASGNRMAFAALAYPLAWGAISVWVCASARLARNALILLVGALTAAAILFL